MTSNCKFLHFDVRILSRMNLNQYFEENMNIKACEVANEHNFGNTELVFNLFSR